MGKEESEGEPRWTIWKSESLPPIIFRRDMIGLAVQGPNAEVCVVLGVGDRWTPFCRTLVHSRCTVKIAFFLSPFLPSSLLSSLLPFLPPSFPPSLPSSLPLVVPFLFPPCLPPFFPSSLSSLPSSCPLFLPSFFPLSLISLLYFSFLSFFPPSFLFTLSSLFLSFLCLYDAGNEC